MILFLNKVYNKGVNTAGMPSSNKTGLVFKISVVLLVLLTLVVYKLNDYFKNEKISSTETRLHQKLVLTKTTLASQLSQLRNTLSAYEMGLDENTINWVQLDPFYAVARVENNSQTLKVQQLLVRTNTPAERWNSAFLEKALMINKSQKQFPIMVQVFQNSAGAKFLIIRFENGDSKELVLVGGVEYFQKFFDLERGEKSTALLSTIENILIAHSEGDYVATQTQETRISKKKYLFEKDEIIGTNLIAMNYILKNKIIGGLAVPWSIIGVVTGAGCILIAILFYNLDPIERKVERYKRQERAQIYKDTLGGMVNRSTMPTVNKEEEVREDTFVPESSMPNQTQVVTPPKGFYSIEQQSHTEQNEEAMNNQNLQKDTEHSLAMSFEDAEETLKKDLAANGVKGSEEDQFLSLENAKMDLSDIEKALALDDFDSESQTADSESSMEALKENLTSQKISISLTGASIDKPQFVLQRKEYRVDSFKVNIRAPEKKKTDTDEIV